MYRKYERTYETIEFVPVEYLSQSTAYSGVVSIQLPLWEIIWRFRPSAPRGVSQAFYIAGLYTPPHSFFDTYEIEMLNEGS